MTSFTYTLTDPEGFHARPAGLFVKEAKKFPCTTTVIKGDKRKGTEVWHSPFYSDQYLRHRRGNSSGCPHWLPDRGVSG